MNKIFLHICCAPCLIYPLTALSEKEYIVEGFFYNPNIHPIDEYIKRRDTLLDYGIRKNIKIIVGDYDIEDYFDEYRKSVDRCFNCYKLRLEKTAEKAKELGFKIFSTTLLYSRRQKHDLIKDIGFKVAEKYNLTFYYEDFRIGWQKGIEESKKLGIYRQKYCGCIFSYKERFGIE